MKPIQDTAARESFWIVVAWCIVAVWMLTVSYASPATSAESPRTLLGMPAWIVWGVMVPWIAATVFTIWFALCYMTDDPPSEADDD